MYNSRLPLTNKIEIKTNFASFIVLNVIIDFNVILTLYEFNKICLENFY